MQNISRKELAKFQKWTRTLPWNQIQFLHQSYFTEEVREQKVKDLFARFQAEQVLSASLKIS